MADAPLTSLPPRRTNRGGRRGVGVRQRPTKRSMKAWLYLLPAAVIYGGFAIWPALNTFYLSFLNWDGVQQPTSAGLSNYVRILQDPMLYNSILHALALIVFFSVFPVCLALLMTAWLLGGVRRGIHI